MNRITKLRLGHAYINETCKCGQPKKPYRWCCSACREKLKQSGEWQKLSAACDAHFEAAHEALKHLP